MSIAIIGSSGAVGKELARRLNEKDVKLFDSHSKITFEDVELAFFCVEERLARKLVPKAREEGVLCIDGSSAYRQDPSVPLVIPEINGKAIKTHQGIIASPNCTTTLMLLPLSPIHKHFQIKRIIASTYQAVSGAGKRGIEALLHPSSSPHIFPHPIAYNLFLHESYDQEEQKMRLETQKILGSAIEVNARCVRVPVVRAHSIAVNVECIKDFEINQIQYLIGKARGVKLKEEPPTPLYASQKEEVFCGSIRKDPTHKNAFDLWIVGDQLIKGAALNMIQIAEKLHVLNH